MKSRALLATVVAVLLACVNAQATPEDPAPASLAALGLGVAPFEWQGPPGAGVPDVAALLAARLARAGVGRVLGPAELAVGGEALDPSAAAVRWASQAGLDAVVVGRTTRLGGALSLDARLLRADGSDAVRTFVAEAPNLAGLDAAADELASQVLEGATLIALAGPEPPAEPAAPPASRPASEPAARLGFSSSDGPLEIKSDELEASEKRGARTLVFKRNVQAAQGDFKLRCQRLEASYPPGSSQPSRLLATGNVVLAQGSQTAWCDEAEYQRGKALLLCRGNGRFRDGDNELYGSEIEIDLESESVRVRGGARIVIEPEETPPVSAP